MTVTRLLGFSRPLRRLPLLLLALLLPGLALAWHPGKDDGIDFAGLAASFAATHCAKGQPCELEPVLARDYLGLRLGAFEVLYPRSALAERGDAGQMGELSSGLLALQTQLLGWLSLAPERAAPLTSDLATLESWIAAWLPAQLARAARADSSDLLEALQADPDVRSAAERLGAAMVDRELLGLAPQFVDCVRVVLVPSRYGFMEWIGFLGQGDSAWARQHWVEGADQWTQFWKGPTLFLALEYAPWSGFDPRFRTALPPEKLDRDGLRQHVLNQAARALLFRLFNRPELEHLERALAADLVIAVTGRIVVLDGEGDIRSSGAHAAPYSRFVPGGLSEGGVLPPASAAGMDSIVKSRWRKDSGSDHFVQALREGQKDGARLAAKDRANPARKDPLAHFAIDSDTRGAKWVPHAPFLGPYASEQGYPEGEFLNDYREFFKAYQAAFYHWLASEAAAGAGASREPFAAFLRGLGSPDFTGRPEELLEQHFGLPISARDGSVDSLEWRFLAWLAEQKR